MPKEVEGEGKLQLFNHQPAISALSSGGCRVMKYHISTRGEPVQCEASVQQCPREHYETEGEALVGFEQSMMGSRSESLQQNQSDTLISVQDVLRSSSLKDLDSSELTQALIHESREAGLDPKAMQSAIGLASVLHSEQRRGARMKHSSTPYIEHPLRNSIRLVRLGVRDQDVIVATVLHDTVEDSSVRYCEKFQGRKVNEVEGRKELSKKIRSTYGPEVQRLVQAVTNDYVSPEDKKNRTEEDKHRIYSEHVRSNISGDAKAYLVKITDFFDNASSLHHSDKPGSGVRVGGRAKKYLRVISVFREEGAKLELGLSKKSHREIGDRLTTTERRLKAIVAKYSS